MKRGIVMTILLVSIIPALLISVILSFYTPEFKENTQITRPKNTDTDDIKDQIDQSEQTIVMVKNGETVLPALLDDYIVCVVLGEMPVDFELEALKAQAVVARTYTCRSLDKPKHKDADVCTNPSCCQAYIGVDDYLKNGGSTAGLEKVKTAVSETAGEVLTYQGELIEATYFSCSGGRTEDARAVWGTDVPYLQSVPSPGEENARHYTDTVRFTTDEFCQLMGQQFSGQPAGWIKNIQYTQGGGIASITIADQTYSGTQIRQKLGLRSTAFVITITGNSVTVTTKGFGHRVGMSQYGAEAMAVQGSDSQQILYHYYLGTQLKNLFG